MSIPTRLQRTLSVVGWCAVLLMVPVLVTASHNININTAGSSELQKLTGIGPSYAQNIIDYREANGSFETIAEIQNVSGIGPATYDNIKDHITVGATNTEEEEEVQNDSDSEVDTGEENDAEDSETIDETESQDSGGGSGGYVLTQQPLSVVAHTDAERVAVRTPVGFSSETYYGDRISSTADRRWNFGDGNIGHGAEVAHTFTYPGTYVVTFFAETFDQEASTEVTVEVVTPRLSISGVREGLGGYVEIYNESSFQNDISGWYITSHDRTYKIPPHTYIAPQSKIRFQTGVLGFVPLRDDMKLRYPDGFVADTFRDIPVAASFRESTAASVVAPAPEEGDGNADVIESKQQATSSVVAGVANAGSSAVPSFFWWIVGLLGIVGLGSVVAVRALRGMNRTPESGADEYTIVD